MRQCFVPLVREGLFDDQTAARPSAFLMNSCDSVPHERHNEARVSERVGEDSAATPRLITRESFPTSAAGERHFSALCSLPAVLGL